MTHENSPSTGQSRQIAVRALGRILIGQEQLEIAISDQADFAGADPRDRAFARLLVTSVLRHKGAIDRILKERVQREPPLFVQNALRIGLAQIFVLETPGHAAVGETVDLVKKHKKYSKMSGLVNGVLRQVIRDGRSSFASTAPRDNIPSNFYKKWSNAYGAGAARQMALEFMKVPPLDLSVKGDAAEWAEKLGGEAIYGQTVRLPKAGQIRSLPGYEAGDWWVQDLASSLPVQLLGDVKGLSVLDMCAAPGGKTLQLAHGGAKVTAIDRAVRRLDMLKLNLERTNLEAEIVEADAAHWNSGDQKFDIVLLDAPCSATGTYRRHPDVLYAKTPKQIGELIKLQRRLLVSAVEKLRVGGVLVYCTCSLEVEESEDQVRDFLHRNKDFDVIRVEDEKWKKAVTEDGFLRLLPHQMREIGGLDGFFVAKLNKKTEQT